MISRQSSPSNSPLDSAENIAENKRISEVSSLVFSDRALSILERLVEYLKDNEGMTYHEIAVALGRDDRTIWTCYNRAQKKRKGNE